MYALCALVIISPLTLLLIFPTTIVKKNLFIIVDFEGSCDLLHYSQLVKKKYKELQWC